VEHLGKYKRIKIYKRFNDKCQRAIEEKDEALSLMFTNPTTDNNNAFVQKLREAKRTIRREKRLWEKERIEQIEKNSTNPRLFFNQTKEQKMGYIPKTEIMIDEKGALVTDGEEIVKQFGNHFNELLNPHTRQFRSQIEYYTAEPEDMDPTDEEISTVIKGLKNNKSPGEDRLGAELYKYGGEELINKIGKLIRKIWKTEEIPKEWQLAIIYPICKKRVVSSYQNYRGISLLNKMYKVLSGIILNRITPYTKDIIWEYQCGIMREKSTIDDIFTVKQLVEKHFEFDKNLH